MKVDLLKLELTIEADLSKNDAEKIRGYLGKIFWDNPYAHHHKSDGSLIYKYPCVQYKVIEKSCLLIGFGEGLEIVKKTFHNLKVLNLNGKWEEILSKALESYTAFFNISDISHSYTFLTPWLALNEKNYEEYQKLGTWKKRKVLLEKILIGNIISMSKSLGYTVPEPIRANVDRIKEVKSSLKGTPMLGFIGTFSVNFEIPDYWGIGKSVSRGFGTVVRTDYQRTDKQKTEGIGQITD